MQELCSGHFLQRGHSDARGGATLLLLPSLFATQLAGTAEAFESQPKFGPAAAPIWQHENYLRAAPAADFWKLNPFYVPQQTSSACSVASVAMALNFLRGLPNLAGDRLVTGILKKIGDRRWVKEVAERGAGVTFAEFVSVVRKSLAAFRLQGYAVEVVRPTANTALSISEVQQALVANEATDRDIIWRNSTWLLMVEKCRRFPGMRCQRSRGFPGSSTAKSNCAYYFGLL